MPKIFNQKKYLILLALFIGCFSLIYGYSTASSINVNLVVEGCNNNNICEAPSEDNLNCPNDCTPCNHNNVCELLKGETPLSCPSDCQVSTTTPPNSSGGGGYSGVPMVVSGEVLNMAVRTGINYAIVSWDTKVPTYGSVTWGVGDNYNDGVINTIGITNHHETVIENLSSNTRYSYSINSSLPQYYNAGSIGFFTTMPIPVIKIIPVVYNLNTTSTENEVVLNWDNPSGADFSGVKIVRSPFFFPTDPSIGKIIYDGKGTYARDSDLDPNTNYFYSIFSYDKDLNFSSAVAVEASLKSTTPASSSTQSSTSTTGTGKGTGGVGATGGTESTNTIATSSIGNFVFTEGNLELPISSSTVRIYPFSDLKIIADVNRFSDQTKTLVLSIQDPSDTSKIFSYIFDLDPTNKFFYVVIPNLQNPGLYQFTITSYGADNKPISVSNGTFDVRAVEVSKSTSMFGLGGTISTGKLWNIYLDFVVLILFISFSIFIRIKR
jgi:hypothetical protein